MPPPRDESDMSPVNVYVDGRIVKMNIMRTLLKIQLSQPDRLKALKLWPSYREDPVVYFWDRNYESIFEIMSRMFSDYPFLFSDESSDAPNLLGCAVFRFRRTMTLGRSY
jgi:hypothetical protein